MSVGSQFSLSLELTQLPELVPVIANTVSRAIEFAREFRKSGSDIIVEHDLAMVFLQNRIDAKFAEDFRKEIVPTDAASVFRALPIWLMKGAGPTVHRALRDPAYFSMVVQLSMLCATQEVASLAEGLCEAFRLRLRDAPAEQQQAALSAESLVGVLLACSDQTASFPWHGYIAHISQKLGVPYGNDFIIPQPPSPNSPSDITPESRDDFKDFYSLSIPLLTASLDMLAIVQRLYKNNIMVIEGSRGCCTMILWAHYVLGQTVRVEGSPKGTVMFGTGEHNVIIIFQPPEKLGRITGSSQTIFNNEQPCVYLMEPSEVPRLKVGPDEDETGVEIYAELKIPAHGYGDAIFAEKLDGKTERIDMGHLTSGLALVFAENLEDENRQHTGAKHPRRTYGSETSSVLRACEFILGPDLFDAGKARYYRNAYAGKDIEEVLPPLSVQEVIDTKVRWDLLRQRACDVALVILAFSAVGNLHECDGLLLGPIGNVSTLYMATALTSWDGRLPIDVGHFQMYLTIARLLGGRKRVDLDNTFLYSNWGWSVYIDSLGKDDPMDVIPGRIWIKKGIPYRNGEYAHCIKNGPYNVHTDMPPIRRIESSDGILRLDCMTTVSILPFLVSLRSDTFFVSGRFKSRNGICAFGYGDLHFIRWSAQMLDPCAHRVANEEHSLSVGMASVTGMDWGLPNCPEDRICISMVYGSGPARWLALAGNGSNAKSTSRTNILKGPGTCLKCALREVVKLRGDQLLIL
jgi:hypothetical protein